MATLRSPSEIEASESWQKNTWSAVHRWKAFHERREHAHRQILARSAVRRGQSELAQRGKVPRRQIPLELLAREWLSEQKAGVDTRTYLVEKLLPTLVVGVEKLLTEVSLRGIAECQEMQPDFNPVNYLAQYLMRNNPCYGSSTEAHPYCRTLYEVSEELKKIALSGDENELEGLKQRMRQRREERERREAVRAQEERHRVNVLKEVFAKWSPEELCLKQLQHVVRSWLETMSDPTLAASLPDYFSSLLEAEDECLSQQDCVDMVMVCAAELPADLFSLLSEHLGVCGHSTAPGNQDTSDTAAGSRDTSDTTVGNRDTSDTTTGNRDTSDTTVGNQDTSDTAAGNQDTAAGSQDTSDTATGSRDTSDTAPGSQDTSDTAAGNRDTSDTTAGNRDTSDTAAGSRDTSDTAPGNRDTSDTAPGNRDTAAGSRDTSDTAPGNRDTAAGSRDTSDTAPGNRDTAAGSRDTSDTAPGNRDTAAGSRDTSDTAPGNRDTAAGSRDTSDTAPGSRDTSDTTIGMTI